MVLLRAALGALLLTTALPAFADDAPAPAAQAGCKQAAKTEPATQPAPASADGTAPGNAGSTGWTGGLGGSNIGTVPSGPTKASKSFQPAVAHGLDPIAGMQKAASGC